MAIGLPFHDQPWSQADALPEASSGAAAGRDAGTGPLPEGALELNLVRAVIEDGLLMVFGPEGDPIPPEVFRLAAAEQPHAAIRLHDGPLVPAERIAAVLKAQTGGRLGCGRDDDRAWIEAMLGIGAQPEPAEQQDLLAEHCAVEVIAFGKELLITSAAGATFLVTEARSRVPESVCLRPAGGGPISVSELVGNLLADAGGIGAEDASAGRGEFAAPDCEAWLQGADLVIVLPKIGPLHLTESADDVGAGALASVFMSSGHTASLADLVRALDRPSGAWPDTRHVSAATPADPTEKQSVPLHLDLPDALAAGSEEAALVMVRGLPEAASLSAGVACGDGTWLLSPRNLAGLSLTLSRSTEVDFPLEVVAITVVGRDGELTSASRTVVVPLRPEAVDLAPAPIPLGLGAQELSAGEPFDAIIVLDVPGDATLSAGTYDPAIDAWVLLPRQLSGLSVLPARAHDQDFTLSLLGVRLKSGGREGPRVLAQVPVTVR